jgi:membrane-bound lytic murein transglycosylase F
MGNAGESGRQRSTIIILAILTTFSGALVGCSQQMTSASFVQKTSSPIEFLSEAAFPESTAVVEIPQKARFHRYLPLIKKFSDKYDMDWVLVLSVMKQESQFDYQAVSEKGAYGLMQIMPVTQIELAEKLGVREATTPRNNIKAGIYHLKWLYSNFSDVPRGDRIRFTLAAYNAGLGRVTDAQKIAAYLGNNPSRWSSVRAALPFLSKKDYTLHSRIWSDGYPPSGYFRDWQQTVDYVKKVMKYYDEYSLALK